MTFPAGLPVIDTMIGFPLEGFGQYDFIRAQTKDRASREEMEFPAEYMFRDVPKDLPTADPVSVTLHEMDRFGVERGLVGVSADGPAWSWASRSSCAPACPGRGCASRRRRSPGSTR